MQRKHILVVDDNPIQLSTREAILRSVGFQVTIATTAAGAMAVVRTKTLEAPVDVVVTDHVMPLVNGTEFVRELRQLRPELPIIVVTGMPGIEEDYQGMHNVIVRQKPIAPADLIALLQQVH